MCTGKLTKVSACGANRRAGSLVIFVSCLSAAVACGSALAEPSRLVGRPGVYFVAQGETLLDIARDNNLGILEVMAANPGADPWTPAIYANT